VKSRSGSSSSESDSSSDEVMLMVSDRFAERSSTSSVAPILLTIFTEKVMDMIRIKRLDKRKSFPAMDLFSYNYKMNMESMDVV
jgi:hypothetical protein